MFTAGFIRRSGLIAALLVLFAVLGFVARTVMMPRKPDLTITFSRYGDGDGTAVLTLANRTKANLIIFWAGDLKKLDYDSESFFEPDPIHSVYVVPERSLVLSNREVRELRLRNVSSSNSFINTLEMLCVVEPSHAKIRLEGFVRRFSGRDDLTFSRCDVIPVRFPPFRPATNGLTLRSKPNVLDR